MYIPYIWNGLNSKVSIIKRAAWEAKFKSPFSPCCLKTPFACGDHFSAGVQMAARPENQALT